jgi:hypothetical protein
MENGMIALLGLTAGLHFMGLTLPGVGTPMADLKKADGYYEQFDDWILPPTGHVFGKKMQSKQMGGVWIYATTVKGRVDHLSVVCDHSKKCGAVDDLKRSCQQTGAVSWTCTDQLTKVVFHLSVCTGRIYWISTDGKGDPIQSCAD